MLSLKGSPKTWIEKPFSATAPCINWRKHVCGVLTKTPACPFLWCWSGTWKHLPSLAIQSQRVFLKEEKLKTARIKYIRQERELSVGCKERNFPWKVTWKHLLDPLPDPMLFSPRGIWRYILLLNVLQEHTPFSWNIVALCSGTAQECYHRPRSSASPTLL